MSANSSLINSALNGHGVLEDFFLHPVNILLMILAALSPTLIALARGRKDHADIFGNNIIAFLACLSFLFFPYGVIQYYKLYSIVFCADQYSDSQDG